MITCTNCDEVIEDAAQGTTACQIINRTPRIQNMSCEIEMLVEKLLAAERAVTIFTPVTICTVAQTADLGIDE